MAINLHDWFTKLAAFDCIVCVVWKWYPPRSIACKPRYTVPWTTVNPDITVDSNYFVQIVHLLGYTAILYRCYYYYVFLLLIWRVNDQKPDFTRFPSNSHPLFVSKTCPAVWYRDWWLQELEVWELLLRLLPLLKSTPSSHHSVSTLPFKQMRIPSFYRLIVTFYNLLF